MAGKVANAAMAAMAAVIGLGTTATVASAAGNASVGLSHLETVRTVGPDVRTIQGVRLRVGSTSVVSVDEISQPAISGGGEGYAEHASIASTVNRRIDNGPVAKRGILEIERADNDMPVAGQASVYGIAGTDHLLRRAKTGAAKIGTDHLIVATGYGSYGWMRSDGDRGRLGRFRVGTTIPGTAGVGGSDSQAGLTRYGIAGTDHLLRRAKTGAAKIGTDHLIVATGYGSYGRVRSDGDGGRWGRFRVGAALPGMTTADGFGNSVTAILFRMPGTDGLSPGASTAVGRSGTDHLIDAVGYGTFSRGRIGSGGDGRVGTKFAYSTGRGLR